MGLSSGGRPCAPLRSKPVPQLRAQLREGPSQLFQIEVPLEAASSDPPRNNPGHSDTIAPGLPTSKQQSNGQPQKRIQNDHSLYYQCRIASCSLSGDKSFPTCGAKTYLFRVKMIVRFTLKSFNHDSSDMGPRHPPESSIDSIKGLFPCMQREKEETLLTADDKRPRQTMFPPQ